MDTAKPLNPSSNVDAADDLIEELARVMADDAQTNTSSPSTSFSNEEPTNFSAPPAGGLNAGRASEPDLTNPGADTLTMESHPNPQHTGTQNFDFESFSLGIPAAEVSDIQFPSTDEDSPTSRDEELDAVLGDLGRGTQDGSSQNPDFDFELGSDASKNNSEAHGLVATDAATSAQNNMGEDYNADGEQVGSDPIAELINAAVSKHSADEPVVEMAPISVPEITPTGSSPEKSYGSSLALDEIESLIGNSIQIEERQISPLEESISPLEDNVGFSENSSAHQSVGEPAIGSSLNSLDTAPIPVPEMLSRTPKVMNEPIVEAQTSVDTAEAAIMQAMAAATTSTNQARASSPPVDENLENQTPELAAGRVKHENLAKGSIAKYAVPALVVLFVIIAGFGGYQWFTSGVEQGEIPVLQADNSPVREAPAPVEQVDQSVVLNEIDGTGAPVTIEQLVSRDETDGVTGEVVRQVITADNSETGLANRRVRTVTVRPDGTIISGDDAVAGGEILPVAQPSLPDLPENAVNSELSNTIVAALPDTPTAVLATTTPAITPVAVVDGNIASVDAGSVPFPAPRLTNRRTLADRALAARQGQPPLTTGTTPSNNTAVDLIANASANTVVTTPPATASSAPALNNSGALVQLASQRTESTARETAANLQSRFSSQLSGSQLVVRRVDLGSRGIYFRVQLPTNSLSDANAICSAIKTAGGDCFTRNS